MSQKNKVLKVIYYDENAAIDYVTIMNNANITIEEINKAIERYDAEVRAYCKYILYERLENHYETFK